MRDAHFTGLIRRGLNQHGNMQAGKAKGVGDGAFVAKIRQRDDHAIDHPGLRAKQFRAAIGFFVRFHRAVLALFRSQRDHFETRSLQRLQHLFPAGFRQMIRKKPPIPYDQAQCHFLLACHDDLRELLQSFQYGPCGHVVNAIYRSGNRQSRPTTPPHATGTAPLPAAAD